MLKVDVIDTNSLHIFEPAQDHVIFIFLKEHASHLHSVTRLLEEQRRVLRATGHTGTQGKSIDLGVCAQSSGAIFGKTELVTKHYNLQFQNIFQVIRRFFLKEQSHFLFPKRHCDAATISFSY